MKAIDEYIEYTGSDLTEASAIESGFKKLTGEELNQLIVGKRVFGDYLMGYRFVSHIYGNGEMEGINNVGTYDKGRWVIDSEKHTLTMDWENGWIDTVTNAYGVNGNIELFDIDTGNWRTTLKKTLDL